jgi:hypothetical protein
LDVFVVVVVGVDVVVVVAEVVVERSVLVCVSACAASVVALADGRNF